MKKKITIGTRGSKLALIYAKIAEKNINKLKTRFGIKSISIKKVTTRGDKVQNKRLSDDMYISLVVITGTISNPNILEVENSEIAINASSIIDVGIKMKEFQSHKLLKYLLNQGA